MTDDPIANIRKLHEEDERFFLSIRTEKASHVFSGDTRIQAPEWSLDAHDHRGVLLAEVDRLRAFEAAHKQLQAENKRLLEEVERIDDLFLNREKDLFIQRREIERLRAGGGDMTHHRPAPLTIRLYLRATGFWAITLPWGTAYYWPWPPNPGLVAHEQVHLDQLARLGPWRFTTRYLWLLMRHGYEQHPMEIEAREISGFR